jgi:hypothetical protein
MISWSIWFGALIRQSAGGKPATLFDNIIIKKPVRCAPGGFFCAFLAKKGLLRFNLFLLQHTVQEGEKIVPLGLCCVTDAGAM